MKMKQGRIRLFRSLEPPGNQKAIRPLNHMSMSAERHCQTPYALPSTGQVHAKGVISATNAVLHPWLKAQLSVILTEIEKKQPLASLPPEEERPLYARWETWLGHPQGRPLPPLRIVLVLDNLAGHLSYDLVGWFFDHGVMPRYTPVGGSWLNMAESVQRIIVRRTLSGQYPENALQVIDWLEQTVAGWNQNPTPFVWNGKRRQRRERARHEGRVKRPEEH